MRAALFAVVLGCGGGAAPRGTGGSGSAMGSAVVAPAVTPSPSPPDGLAAVTTAALAVEACRFYEATKGYALDVACPQLTAVRAARAGNPSVRAVALAPALAASPSAQVRLYLVYALAADARSGAADAAAAEAAIVAALGGEVDASTRNKMIGHLVATQVVAPLRARAAELLASAAPDDRHAALALLTTEPLASEAASIAGFAAVIAHDPDSGVRAAACGQLALVDATGLLPPVDAVLAAPDSAAAVVTACLDGLAAVVGDPRRAATLRAAALQRLLTALEQRPRNDTFPASTTLARLAAAIEPTRLRPTATAAEPWFERARVVKIATAVAGDAQAGELARSQARAVLAALTTSP